MTTYTGGSVTKWREVEGGQLPSRIRAGLRATMVDNIIYVTGGDDGADFITSILSWDPSTESWQPAGDLAVGRVFHAAVALPSSMLESECSTMFLP